MEITGWMFTDARNLVSCPRCGASQGEWCRSPKGKKTKGGIPHVERLIELGSKRPDAIEAARLCSTN